MIDKKRTPSHLPAGWGLSYGWYYFPACVFITWYFICKNRITFLYTNILLTWCLDGKLIQSESIEVCRGQSGRILMTSQQVA